MKLLNWITRRKPAVTNASADSLATAGSTPFGTGWNGLSTNAGFWPLKRLNEALPFERRNLLAGSRYLDNNLGIVGALNDGSVRHAIGSGINAYACTGDPDYDSAADRFIEALFGSPDLDITGEQTMYEMQAVVARGMIVDGDVGAAKILQRDAGGLPVGDPQIQLFTSDQIGDGDGKGLMPGEKMAQGIARNSVGRATRYRVLKDRQDTPGALAYWDYRPQDFMLVLDRKRIQLNRGMPWCHRATKNGFSMLDLSALEEQAAYVNALFAAIITTPDGQTPEALEKFLVQKLTGPTATTEKTAGTPEQKAFVRKFVEFFGGAKVPVFPQGTELKAYQSDRPSTVFTGFMDYLVTMLASSYVVPANFVWAIAGKTGPETRMTLAQAAWYFNYILLIIVRRFLKPARDWCLQFGLLTGRLNNGRGPRNGADFRLASFHGPRDITIDERYYHKTWLDRLAAGKGTEEEYYSLQGQNADTQALKRIKEIARRKQWCKEHDVEYHGEFVAGAPGMRVGADAGAATDPALQEQQQQQADAAA